MLFAGGVSGEEEHNSLDWLGASSEDDSQASSTHTWSQSHKCEKVNNALQLFDESPLKQSRADSEVYINDKISKLNKKMRDTLGISNPENDGEGFTASLKERFETGDRMDRYRCLTLCPVTWYANRLSKVFGCSRDMAATALRLRETHGPGSFPGKKQGRKLPDETKLAVVNFYLDRGRTQKFEK